MIVPQYWAEGRLQHREKGRQVTLRRFGWSDRSQAEAQASADLRVAEAMARVLAGEKLPPREPKIPYNGAVGVPIREEIVDRHGDVVITRNSYGARCLNSPDVLFADVDFAGEPGLRNYLVVAAMGLLAAIAIGWLSGSRGLGVAVGVVAMLSVGTLTTIATRTLRAAAGGAETSAHRRIRRFLAAHPDWNLRLYRTPAGLRVIATQRRFDPTEEAVTAFFRALATDPLYAAMCRNQRCFRARLTAKPWRIGIDAHMKPRPGTWPVTPERLPERAAWIEAYEAAAAFYAACAFEGEHGSGSTDPRVAEVVALHDGLCSAHGKLPIA